MKRTPVYLSLCTAFLAQSTLANSVDQSQTNLDAQKSVAYFAPMGQTFTPQNDTLSSVHLKLTDGAGSAGANAYLEIRQTDLNGAVVATSQTVNLADCFNFSQGPGCGLSGGSAATVAFTFNQPVNLTIGQTYALVLGSDSASDDFGVGYSYGDDYANGAMYTQGMATSTDWWFETYSPDMTLLVSTDGQLKQYSLDGTLVQTQFIPANASNETPRDLIAGAASAVHLFNGTFDPLLSTLSQGQWTHSSFSGWSIPNNVSYGGIARVGTDIIVTDGMTYQGGEAKGLVRFDTTSVNSPQRYLDENAYIDVTLGQDGKLYALRNTYGDLDVIDPQTMTILNSVDLGHTSSSRAVTADSSGTIFMASWDGNLYRYSASGTQEASLDLGTGTYDNDLYDIDIAPNGTIAVGNRFGKVFVTDTSLQNAQSFSVSNSGAFVAFSGGTSTTPDTEEPEPQEPTYCESSGQNTSYEWIESIGVNATSRATGTNGGYLSDLDDPFTVLQNQSNTLVLTPGYRYSNYMERWRAWIDYNHNGQFELSERLLDQSSNSAFSVNFQPPANTSPGTYRLRVAMKYGSAPSPCGNFYYGEVEDYSVTVQ